MILTDSCAPLHLALSLHKALSSAHHPKPNHKQDGLVGVLPEPNIGRLPY